MKINPRKRIKYFASFFEWALPPNCYSIERSVSIFAESSVDELVLIEMSKVKFQGQRGTYTTSSLYHLHAWGQNSDDVMCYSYKSRHRGWLSQYLLADMTVDAFSMRRTTLYNRTNSLSQLGKTHTLFLSLTYPSESYRQNNLEVLLII